MAEATPLGTRIKIHTTDGKRVTGTLMRVDDTAMTLKRNTRLPEAPVIINFDRVDNMERDSGGMSWAKAIGFGAGAGAAAILTILTIALQLD